MYVSDKYIGKMLDNRYEILELIGKGGMAYVYRARCHRLNRYVAVKILKEDLAGDEEFRRRFHTESQAVGMLSHPNIVSVYDVSRSDNTEYIVMELIEGITLKQYINRKGLLNWKEALHFSTQMAKALRHAHSRGIIHRDIKPHNIMILKDGSVKVADFGIARLLSMQNTLTQETLGSVHYISPEQAKGGQVDARSDIYSVGVVMYEMLTSRLPFVGDSAVSVAIQHISAIPLMPRELNPEVPIGLENITMHAMEPDLNMRFTTADEMLNDLEEFRKNPSITFSYVPAEPADRRLAAIPDEQETKLIRPPANGIAGQRVERAGPRELRAAKKKPDYSSDEFRPIKKRAASTSTLVGIFLIILFLVAVVVFMWNYLLKDIFSPQAREQIEIPGFVNRMYEDIIDDDEYSEIFNFRAPVWVFSEIIDEGLVIAQSPDKGEKVDTPLPGNKVNVELTVSRGGEPTVQMPNLLNQHFINAQNELNALGMDLKILPDVVADEREAGYVIRTIPKAGVELARGDSVSIIYSGGPKIETVEVPDQIGHTKAQAETAFELSGITPVFIEWEDDSPEGTVLFIEKMGQMISIPATIEVHISKGPPPTPEPETVEVPNQIGRTKAQVEAAFELCGITPVFIEWEDDTPEGTVIFIEKMGQMVSLPASVEVYVSKGPPPTPEAETPETEQPETLPPETESPVTDPQDTEDGTNF